MPQGNHHHFLRKCLNYQYHNYWLVVQCSYACFVFREFYTGWLTHWGEDLQHTGAGFTASALEKIFSQNGSAVLYVCPC